MCARFGRNGKAMPYTSANGYLFSLLNKAGEIGIRFSKEVQKKYMGNYKTTLYISYNSIMHGYVLITDEMMEDMKNVSKLLDKSYYHVMSLDPK